MAEATGRQPPYPWRWNYHSLAGEVPIPVVAVAAADAEGLRRQRIHFEDLWGDSVTQYEPDVALILNRDTVDVTGGVRTGRLATEKNRNGPSEVEFRHQLHGAYFYLRPDGEPVSAEESYQGERAELRRQKRASHPAATAVLLSLLQRLDGASNAGLTGLGQPGPA